MNIQEFANRVRKIQLAEIKFLIDWSKINIGGNIYPAIVLELDDKRRKISLKDNDWERAQWDDHNWTKLELAILSLVRGNTISKPSKGSANYLAVYYKAQHIKDILQKARKKARKSKTIQSSLKKALNKANRKRFLAELKAILEREAFGKKLRRQDVIAVWDEIVRESIVFEIMTV